MNTNTQEAIARKTINANLKNRKEHIMNTTNPNANKAIAIADTLPTFKNEALNAETRTIFESVNSYNKTANETRKAVAVALHHIEKDKLYRDDGHKSLAEYAATIGLDKSLAHKLENAGRLLDSDDETVRNFAAATDYSKLSILASADSKDLTEAVKSGELSPDSTQAQVKDWKASKKSQKAPTVLLPYELDFTVYRRNGAEQFHYDSILLDEVEEFIGVDWGKVKVAGSTVIVGIHPDGSMVRIIKQEKVKQEKPKKEKYRPGTQFDPSCLTDEMLAAAMAELARRKGEEGV